MHHRFSEQRIDVVGIDLEAALEAGHCLGVLALAVKVTAFEEELFEIHVANGVIHLPSLAPEPGSAMRAQPRLR